MADDVEVLVSVEVSVGPGEDVEVAGGDEVTVEVFVGVSVGVLVVLGVGVSIPGASAGSADERWMASTAMSNTLKLSSARMIDTPRPTGCFPVESINRVGRNSVYEKGLKSVDPRKSSSGSALTK